MPIPKKIEPALRELNLTATQYGGMTQTELRRHWRDLIKQFHPDRPENRGRAADAGAINAAYDALRQNMIEHEQAVIEAAANAPDNIWKHDRAAIAPPWQPDKNARNNVIQVASYRDVNYLKKRIWELSKGSQEIYTINAFGRTNFEGRTRVYGSQDVFDEMAKAMLIWNANGSNVELTRAVLVSSHRDHTIYLVYADGKSMAHNPIPLPYNAQAGSPEEDKDFQSKLPLILDKIRDLYARRSVA
jgi:hypothetical protein